MDSNQLSLHCKMFNEKVRHMNQAHKKELVLTASEAKSLQADIFNLLVLVASLAGNNPAKNDSVAVTSADGGAF